MKIEDVSGLRRRASMAAQLTEDINHLRTMLAQAAESDSLLVLAVARRGGHSLNASSHAGPSAPGKVARNCNPVLFRATILRLLESELNSRLAALEAL